MQRITNIFFCTILALVAASSAFAGPVSLTLQPANGSVVGGAGDTVGWGFTLANSSAYSAIITSAAFCDTPISSPCIPPLGVFTDFIAQYQFTVVDPHSSLSALYDPGTFSGIGSFAIAPGAHAGDSFSGHIVLTYDLYGDPNDPFTLISTDNQVAADASVSVPEMPVWVLLACGLVAVLGLGRRTRALV